MFIIVWLSSAKLNANKADIIINTNCKNAFTKIMYADFDSAAFFIANEKKINPFNKYPYYLENYIDLIKILINEAPDDIEYLDKNFPERIHQIGELSSKSPWRSSLLSEMYLQMALCNLKTGNHMAASFQLLKSYNNMTECVVSFPDFDQNKKIIAIYNLLIGSVPDQHKWIVNVFGFKGNLNTGLNLIKYLNYKSKKTNEYNHIENASLYLLVNHFMNNNFKPGKFLEKELIESPVYRLIFIICLVHSNQNEPALGIIVKYKKRPSEYEMQLLEYFKGILLLNKLDENSKNAFISFLKNYKGTNLIKSAHHKLAWNYLIEGQKERYKEELKKVLIAGNTLFDSDEYAQKEAENNAMPDVTLLKSRLLFDGGYYEKAKEELEKFGSNKESGNKSAIIEYHYRNARIGQMSGDTVTAVTDYIWVYNNAKDLTSYFAANSLLELGNIEVARKNDTKAREYYSLCLEMKNSEYRNSIQNKAKAALEKLNN